jgi:hypothetical protein
MKMGFDLQLGSGIFYISEASSSKSLVNSYDGGRFIQQSYYGNEDGSVWPGMGNWRWNPVQGSSYDNQASRINAWGATETCFRSTVTPRNWAGTNIVEDVVMEQTVCLVEPTVAKCHFSMTYKGQVRHEVRHQEVPAVFVDRSLSKLMTYIGSSPWTNQPLSNIAPPPSNPPKNSYNETIAENWVAWVNDDDYGVGVCFPHTAHITMYIYEAGDGNASTCYVAPLWTKAINPGDKWEYDVYIAIGKLDNIRTWFQKYAKP